MNPELNLPDDFDLQIEESEISEEERAKIAAARDSVSQLIQLYPEHSDILIKIRQKAENRDQEKSAAHDYLDLTKMDGHAMRMLGDRIRINQAFSRLSA